MTNLIRRHSAAMPLIIGTIIALIATVLVGLISTPTPSSHASTAPTLSGVVQTVDKPLTRKQKRLIGTCSDVRSKFGNNLVHDNGNLLGGIHIWRTELKYKECDNFDNVIGIIVKMTKENGRCSNGALVHVNNYDFNPNALGGWNPGTFTKDCISGQEVYNIGFVAPSGTNVNTNDSSAARCIGVSVQIDLGPLRDDYNGSVPTVCLDGA